MATMTLELSASKPSMADTLPSVNFGFDELRDRMAKFTIRFDSFIERERKRVLDERNKFHMSIAELQEKQQHHKRDIEYATQKSNAHSQTVAKENAETAEMKAQISELESHREQLLEQFEAKKAQLETVQATLNARRDAQTKHTRYLHSQARFNEPELAFFEEYLCVRIDGAGLDDRLKFVFTHVCEKDWQREAWFELDTSIREYSVIKTKPKLVKDDVAACQDHFNEKRELGSFLKEMRELFVKAMK